KASGTSQNSSHLREGRFLILHVMERDDRGDPVEGGVRKRDLLRAALLKSNSRSELSALGDFPPVRLEDDHFGAARRELFRRGARTPSDIEEANSGDGSAEGAQLGEVRSAVPGSCTLHQWRQDINGRSTLAL